MTKAFKNIKLKKVICCIHILCFLLVNGDILSQDLNTTFAQDKENLFNFWIGDWEVSWNETDGTLSKGINTVEKILEGNAIQENFQGDQRNPSGLKGISISTYKKELDQWRQVWTDNKGGYIEFYGKVNGKKRIFQTQMHQKNGKNTILRMVFKNIQKDSFTWDWEISVDNGRTWKLNWQIFYKRIEANKALTLAKSENENHVVPNEINLFGQFVGIWDCTSFEIMPDSTWKKNKALWAFNYVPGGFAIEDIWKPKKEDQSSDTPKFSRDFYGKNIRIFNQELNKWQCFWIPNQTATISSTGQAVDDELGQIIMKDETNLWRIVFNNITSTSFDWKYESSRNGEWVIMSKRKATKIE